MKDVSKKRKAASKDDEDAIPSKKKITQKATTKKETNKQAASPNSDKDGASNLGVEFTQLTLQDIRDRIQALAKDVPEIPADGFYMEGCSPNETSGVIGEPPNNLKKALIKGWSSQLQIALEELGLVLCCVSSATYRWGTDRSGAADQNLTLLNDELNSSQDQIASRVTPRLRNVLTPVVDLVVERTITTKSKRPKNGGGKDEEDEMVETKQNVFTRHLEDPDFVHLCYEILARNAPMMRLVVMTCLHKMVRCITDYLAVHINDTQHHREFAY